MRNLRGRITILALLIVSLIAGSLALSQTADAKIHSYKIGHYHKVGDDWRVKVVKADYNADSTVAAGSQYNDKPRPHYRYVLVKVRGQKLSSGSSALDSDERWQLRGHHTHHVYSLASENLPPDYNLSFNFPSNKGEKAAGWLVFEVKKSDIRDGHLLLRVESYYPSVVKYFKTH